MKHTGIIVMLCLMLGALQASAQTVTRDDFGGVAIHFNVPQPKIAPMQDGYMQLQIDGYQLDARVGAPQVPVFNAPIAIPLGAELELVVRNAVYDTIDLPDTLRLRPQQPSRSKSDSLRRTMIIDEQLYATDAFVGHPLAEAKVQGMMRDKRLAVVSFSPVWVNPVQGIARVCRHADVEVRFVGGDAEATLEHYRRYHSPSFSAVKTLNNLFTKTDASAVPVRIAIVAAANLRSNSLARFADWKRKQGMITTLTYTDDLGGSDTTTVSAYLQSLYDTASAQWPAPTYVLMVGDNNNLPAFGSHISTPRGWEWYFSFSDHITDLHHVAWDGNDYLPEAYVGRFSATDTTTLAAIISKTLLYEQYDFEDDSYLGKAILVAGEDEGYTTDNAYQYCDPTMDYAASLYVNADGGFSEVKYYKNRTNFAPTGVTVTGSSQTTATATTLRSLYSQGYGWINYSAHGEWNEWYKPGFTVSQVSSMNNNGRPSVMIGNCCLTNKFEKPACFSETLLRRAGNAGAVAYVGASAETFWEQDFIWAVGVRSNISGTMTPTYSAPNLGMYDRLFHTHNEDFADYAFTMGSMIYAGNMAVQTTNPTDEFESKMLPYYWEIYGLMGDPSLMPWLGSASELTDFAFAADGTVQTVPYAYVALVDADLNVLSAAYADTLGLAHLDVSEASAGCFFSVTAQGYKPFFYQVASLGTADVREPIVRAIPNPASEVCTLVAEGMRQVELYDANGRRLLVQKVDADRCTLPVAGLTPGLYIARITTASTVLTTRLVVAK